MCFGRPATSKWLLAKTALLFVLWLVLCIPLSEILGLIRERGDSQRSAAEELVLWIKNSFLGRFFALYLFRIK